MSRDRSRIVYLHPSDDWYGSDRVAWESIQALVTRSDVEVLVPVDFMATAPSPLSDRLRRQGVRVTCRPLPVLRRALLRPGGLLNLLGTLVRFAFTVPRADVYVVNTAALALCVPVLRLRGAHVVVHLHEALSRSEGAVLGLALRWATRVLTVSESAHSCLPVSVRRKASVLPNFVDSPEQVPLPSAPPLRAVFVGRWTPRKGLAELVDVWRRLDPDRFHLTVLGGFPVSGVRADFDPKATDLLPHIDVIGEVEDPTPHLDRAHVVIVPSLLPEGLPMAGLEALGRGRPLIATRQGGLVELVTHETGWQLDPTRPDLWQDVLERVELKELAAKQEACIRLCRSRYSRSRFVEGLVLAMEPS